MVRVDVPLIPFVCLSCGGVELLLAGPDSFTGHCSGCGDITVRRDPVDYAVYFPPTPPYLERGLKRILK